MKYIVRVVETYSRDISVEASCACDAKEIVKEQYVNNNVIMDSDDYDHVQFLLLDTNNTKR